MYSSYIQQACKQNIDEDEESWTALKDFYVYCKKNYGDTVMFGLSDY